MMVASKVGSYDGCQQSGLARWLPGRLVGMVGALQAKNEKFVSFIKNILKISRAVQRLNTNFNSKNR